MLRKIDIDWVGFGLGIYARKGKTMIGVHILSTIYRLIKMAVRVCAKNFEHHIVLT